MHTKHTANMGNQLNIPVDELKLGADDDVLMLATQETLAKNLVYITNIPEGKLDTTRNVRDSSKNPGKQDNKKSSPLEKSDFITSNDNLNAYGESGRDDNPEKGKERKKKTWNTRKTHKAKLDVICKHRYGSTARVTWEVKIVPQLNHDLFSFTKAMKEGWQMNDRWKEGGLMIELFKTTKTSMKFDRMILSGSSWLVGIKTQRLVGQAHAVIEPGKSIPIWKFYQMTGHTGEHLLRTTAEDMGIKLTGKLEPCEICAQAKIRQANVPKKKEKQVPSRPGYRLFIDISSFKHESMGGKRHWLIVVDEFSDCSHSFFLKKKSDQIEMIPIWIKELKAKYGIDIKYIRLDNSGENKSLQKECDKQNLGIIFEFRAPGTPSKIQLLKEKYLP